MITDFTDKNGKYHKFWLEPEGKKYGEYSTEISPCATILPPLEFAITNFDGPILELGCGYFSTRFLTTILKGREIHSVESKEEWYFRIKNENFHSDDWHHIYFLPEDKWMEPTWIYPFGFHLKQWGIILIDNSPGAARLPQLINLINRADILLVHDYDAKYHGKHLWDRVEKKIRYFYETPHPFVGGPTTGLFSNKIDIIKVINKSGYKFV